MENLKKLKNKLESEGYEFPLSRFQFGIKLEGGGVQSTGRHEIKFLAEPRLEMRPHPHTQIDRQVVVFLLEDKSGVKYEWDFPVFIKKDNKILPHYLIQRLIDVPVGEWLALEMQQKSGKNYYKVEYPLDGKNQTIQTSDDGQDDEGSDVYIPDTEQDE